MDDSQRDLQAVLTHATDRLIRAARTLAFWVGDDDDLPSGSEMPSEEDSSRAVGEVCKAITQIQLARLEIAGQMALFEDDHK